MDELQILTCKVIIKKLDFRNNLDTTLKQHYTSQLFDRNSVSIAKTLLGQMQQCSFMEFHNKLARELGTCQHAISKASVKPITTKSVEVGKKRKTFHYHHHHLQSPMPRRTRRLAHSLLKSKTSGPN